MYSDIKINEDCLRYLEKILFCRLLKFEGEWLPWCKANGIICEVTPSYTSQNNSAAESGIRTIVEWARCALEDAGLYHKYLAEVVATLVYLMNYIPSARHPDESPFELWSKVRPNVAHLRAFGCDVYMEIPIIHIDGKLSVQSKKLRLIGYHGSCQSTQYYRRTMSSFFVGIKQH